MFRRNLRNRRFSGQTSNDWDKDYKYGNIYMNVMSANYDIIAKTLKITSFEGIIKVFQNIQILEMEFWESSREKDARYFVTYKENKIEMYVTGTSVCFYVDVIGDKAKITDAIGFWLKCSEEN